MPTGVKPEVAVAGDRGAPTTIFLHGFLESHRTWRHQIAALADHYGVGRFVPA